MLRTTLIISSLLFIVSILSKGQNIDSLIQKLTTPLPDSQRAKILNSLAFYYSDVNLDSATQFAQQAITMVDNISNPRTKSSTYDAWSIIEKLRGNYSNSLTYSYKALKLVTDANDTLGISTIVNNMALTYNILGDYGAAVDNLLLAISYDEARKDTLGLGVDYINLSYSYYESKNYDIALTYAQKALSYLRIVQDQHAQSYAYELMASIHLGKQEPETAKPFIITSLRVAKETNNEYTYQNNLKQMGDYYYQKRNFDSAHYYYDLSMIAIAQNPFTDNLLLSTVAMARCYHAQKDLKNALATALDGYHLSLKGKNKNFTQEICNLLGEIYQAANNLPESVHYLKLSTIYKDSILNQSIGQSLESRMIQSSLTKEQNERKAIALDLEQRDKQVYWQRLIILSAGVTLLILIVGLLLIRKSNLLRKKINEQLEQKNAQLESLNREINGLVQTIVHDLKSPFNTLQGIFSLIEIEKTNTETQELLVHGKKAISNGQDIIQQLLTIREAEENILTLNKSSFEVDELITDVIEDYTPASNEKNISIDITLAGGTITTDHIILRRVLDNLISNAIKFTPHEGRVTIASKKENGALVLEVADNGPGFSSHDMDKIFGKFQRLSARPTGGESSNGLGLAIVDILLKKIAGTISLKTEPGKGAHFTVKIAG